MRNRSFRFMPKEGTTDKQTVDVWLVIGVKKTGNWTDFTLLDSVQDKPLSPNQVLVPVFPDEAASFDYVIVVRQEEAIRKGWLKL